MMALQPDLNNKKGTYQRAKLDVRVDHRTKLKQIKKLYKIGSFPEN